MRVKLQTGVVVFAVFEGLAYVVALLWADLGPDLISQVTVTAPLLIGLSFTGVGLVTWTRQPASRVGPLMVTIGLTWPLSGLVLIDDPIAFTLGNLAPILYIPFLLRLVVTFPQSRPTTTMQRLVLGAGYAVIPVSLVVTELLVAPASRGCDSCPPSLLYIEGDIPWRNTAYVWTSGISGTLAALAAIVAIIQWRRIPRPRRHALGAVFPPAIVALGLFTVGELSTVLRSPSANPFVPAVYLGATIAFTLWPLGMLVGLARAKMHRAEIVDLAVALGTPLPPGDIQQVLSDALRDRSLQLAYWLPDSKRFVDVNGNSVDIHEIAGTRRVTMLETAGRRVAALLHDPALDEDPVLVRAAASTARLAIENDRLHAQVRAQLSEVLASRARILDTANAVRRQLERDLHDGAQQRLVNLALMVGLAQSRLRAGTLDEVGKTLGEAADELSLALTEMRELARGIHPAILTNAGLGPALESLAERAPLPVLIVGAPVRRLPARVEETAYFIASEGIANTAKHANASKVEIELRIAENALFMTVSDDGTGGADPDGSGLRGLADRVAAVRGVFRLEPQTVSGTRLSVELPCD
jgi:signal transduction histidine kinase